MTVTVIDSGINCDFVFNNKITILSYIELVDNGIRKFNKNDFSRFWLYNKKIDINDYTNHGTKVVSIISSFSPDIKFRIIKILDCNNKSNEDNILKALKISILKYKTDFINLSLGIFNAKNKKKLFKLLEIARRKNITVICATSSIQTFPSSFSNVISVGNQGMLETSYESKWTDIYIPDNYFNDETIDSTSMACAYWTGFLSKYYVKKKKVIYENQ